MIMVILLSFGEDLRNMSYRVTNNNEINKEIATFIGCSFVGCFTAFFMVLFIIWFVSLVF